jgi:hypothetical protein
VAAAQLNGDSMPDLITTNPTSGDISVLLSGFGGSYAAEERIDVEGLPTRFVAGDWDDDGHPDIAAVLFSDEESSRPLAQIAVLAGAGGAAFEGPRYFGSRGQTSDLAAADFNDDGDPDFITANTGTSDVSLIYGRGDGSFETDERFAVGARPRTVLAARMDRDAVLDVVTANLDSQDVSVLIGNGDGTFEAAVTTEVSDVPRDMVTGNFNGDAHLDLVATNLNDSSVSVLLGRGDGRFQAERRFSIRTAEQAADGLRMEPRSVVTGDFNDDGNDDIMTGNAEADAVAVILGDGTGSFSGQKQSFIGNFPLGVKAADMNGDGILDAVAANGFDPDPGAGAPTVTFVPGLGDGSFDEEERRTVTTGDGPENLALADLDGDGDFDAVTVHPGSGRVYVLAGSSSGKLQPGDLARVNEPANSLIIGDVNDDNRRDILTSNTSDSISVLLNRGGLSFQSPLTIWAGHDPISGALADVDGDGVLDLVWCNRGSDDVSVLRGAE